MRLAWFAFASVALASGSLTSAQNLQDVVKQGEQVFNRSCATGYCHGLKGVAAAAPRLAARGFDEAYIENAVSRGLPGTSMAAFSGSLSRSDLRAVITYVANLNGIVYSPAVPSENSNGAGVVLSAEASRGRVLFSDPLRSFGRCSTCHEVNGIGTPVATPIATVPADVQALRGLATPSVRTAILNHEAMPALVLSNGSREIVFYDLTTPPPVRHTAQPDTVMWRDGSNWKHSSVAGSYNDAELNLILAYLRSVVQP